MRMLLCLLILLCASCEAPVDPPRAERTSSVCLAQHFEGSRFTVCDPGEGQISIRFDARRFPDLGVAPSSVLFAMNGGMFGEDHGPIGLSVADGREVHAINRRKGYGNFHLLPNGVFLVRNDGRASVVSSDRYRPSPDIRFATQSGPMLLIDGQLHPGIDRDGVSHFIRNAVGITPDGRARFVISDDAVSFGRLARFMHDQLGMKNALFLDGSVSSLWDPAGDRMDNFTDLGPIILVSRSGASAPDHEVPAKP